MAATVIKTYSDFQKYNFFRSPQWRWERVLSLIDRDADTPGRCNRRDDQIVKTARNFVLRWRNSDNDVRERLTFENPGLTYAYNYHQRQMDDPDCAMYIQARTLARQTPEDISKTTGMLPEAIQWYIDLFFDVTPYIDQRDWITKQVLLPAIIKTPQHDPDADNALPMFRDSTVSKPFMDGSIKLFAYFGGPYIVDLLLAGMQPGKPVTSPEDIAPWLDNNITTTLRRRTAQASTLFEINKYNVLELVAVHNRIMEIARSDDSQEMTKSTQEKHIEAMLQELPWAVGDDAEKIYANTVVGRFDQMSAELRDDELLLVASGRPAPTIEKGFLKELPPPRPKKAHLTSGDVTLP